jgi:hypothetical protein
VKKHPFNLGDSRGLRFTPNEPNLSLCLQALGFSETVRRALPESCCVYIATNAAQSPAEIVRSADSQSEIHSIWKIWEISGVFGSRKTNPICLFAYRHLGFRRRSGAPCPTCCIFIACSATLYAKRVNEHAFNLGDLGDSRGLRFAPNEPNLSLWLQALRFSGPVSSGQISRNTGTADGDSPTAFRQLRRL